MLNVKILVPLMGAALLSAVAPAQEAKSGHGVLHPEMTVGANDGSWDKPAGTMGQKTETPWTDTTVNAGVDKKPLQGKVITVTGEIIDLSCYLQLGKHGEKHKSCGTKCIHNGQPIGLLAKNGTVYMLIEEEHDPRRDGQTTFRKTVEDNFAKIMEVTGTETMHNGYRAIYVQGYVNK